MQKASRMVLAGVALSLVLASPLRAAWVQVNGPEPPVVSALVRDAGVLMLGSNESDAGDVYRSADDGQHWTNAGLPSGGVTGFLAHTSGLYVGTYLSGLYKSTDQGASWLHLTNGVGPSDIVSALASVGTDTLLAALDNRPIYRSTNQGGQWTQIPACPTQTWNFLAVSGAMVFAGTAFNGVLRSTDRGVSWAPANTGLPASSDAGAGLIDGGFVYIGITTAGQPSSFGVYRSSNNGQNWTKVSTDLPSSVLLHFAVLAARGGTLYAGLDASGGGQGLYRSSDGGVHWSFISGGISGNPPVESLLLDQGALLAGTPLGVFRSDNDGESWSYSGHGTAAIRGTGSLLQDGSAILLGLETNGDLGRGIWRTDNAGEAWSGPASGVPFNTTARAMAHAGGEILAGLYGPSRGVYRSSDGGLSWTASTTGISTSTIINTIHEHGGVELVGAFESLYRSTNLGHTWSAVSGAANAYDLLSDGPDLYAGLYGAGVRRSTDEGQTWSDMNEGLTNPASLTVTSLARHQGQLFAGTNGAGVFRRDGALWVPAGLPAGFVNALLDVDGALVAASALSGVFCTTNSGAQWQPFSEAYGGGEVEALATDGTLLYAGSRGHALWARPLAELPVPASASDARGAGTVHLDPAYPNPFRDWTTLGYSLDAPASITLRLYDVEGRLMARCDEGWRGAGAHAVRFSGKTLPAGVYLYRLQVGARRASGTLRLVR